MSNALTWLGQDYDDSLASILAAIDSNPDVETIAQTITDLEVSREEIYWKIGDILVFIRERWNYSLVGEYGYSEPWPDEAWGFLREVGIDRSAVFEKGKFLVWDTYRHGPIMVLVKPGQDIRIWQQSNNLPQGEDAFIRYLAILEEALRKMINVKTLSNYFRTAYTFPPDARIQNSWTFHYEVSNWVGRQIGAVDLEQRRLLAAAKLEELQEQGVTTVTGVRQLKRENEDRERGYSFRFLELPDLAIVDTETGEIQVALRYIAHPTHYQQVLRSAGLITGSNLFRLNFVWNGKQLLTGDGDPVAECPNPDHPIAERALVLLAGKMGWIIKDRS